MARIRHSRSRTAPAHSGCSSGPAASVRRVKQKGIFVSELLRTVQAGSDIEVIVRERTRLGSIAWLCPRIAIVSPGYDDGFIPMPRPHLLSYVPRGGT